MLERHIGLDLPIDLEPYSGSLLARKGGYRYNPIALPLLFSLVPVMGRFNSLLEQEGWTMFKPKTMTVPPGDFNGIHIDSSSVINDYPLSLGINMPIANGSSSITRWYNFGSLDINIKQFFWDNNKDIRPPPELDSLTPQQIVDRYCVDTMVLDRPSLFFSGQPHNVDSRHSEVWRSILSFRLVPVDRAGGTVGWANRHQVAQAINAIGAQL
jgi:hypothetical protein